MILHTLQFFQSFAALAAGLMCGISLLTDAPIKNKLAREFFFFALFSILLSLSIFINTFNDMALIPQSDIILWRNAIFIASFAALMIFGLYALGATTGSVLFITSLTFLGTISGILLFGDSSLIIPFVLTAFPASLIAMFGMRKMAEDSTNNLHGQYLTLCCALGMYMLMLTLLLLGRIPGFPGSGTLGKATMFIRAGACAALILECYVFFISSTSNNSTRTIKRMIVFASAVLCFMAIFAHYSMRFTKYGDKLALAQSTAKMREVGGIFSARMNRAFSLASLFTDSERIKARLDQGASRELILEVQNLLEQYKESLPYVSVYLLDSKGTCAAAGEKTFVGAPSSKLIPGNEFAHCSVRGTTVFLGQGTTDHDQGVYAAKRIDAKNGKMSGMVIVKLSREYFLEAFPENLFFAFLDNSGTVLMSSERALAETKIDKLTQKSFVASRLKESGGQQTVYGEKGERLRNYLFIRGILTPSFNSFSETWHFITGEKNRTPLHSYMFGVFVTFFVGSGLLLLYAAYKVFVTSKLLSLAASGLKKTYFLDSMAGVATIDASFRIDSINNRALSILGRQRSECVGKTFSELAPISRSAETARFSERLEKLFKDGSSSAGLCYFERKNSTGEYACIYSLSRLAVHETSVDEKKFGALVFMDISDFAERIRSLELGEKQIRSLAEAVHGHIFMLTTKGEFISSNDSALASTIEKGVKVRLNDFFPVETAILFKTMLDNINVMKNQIAFEHTQDVCGTERIFSDTLFPVINAGRVVSVGAVVMDITQAKRTENALRETEKKLHAVSSAGNTAVWETNKEGTLIFCRHSFPCGQFQNGTKPIEFYNEDDAERIKNAAEESIKTAKPFKIVSGSFKLPNETKSRTVILTGDPFFSANGTFAGFRGFVIEIPSAEPIKE